MTSYIQNVIFYNTTEFSQMETNISQMMTGISQTMTGVFNLKADISQMMTGISQTMTGVSLMIPDVSTLKTDVTTLKTDISTLNPVVSTLKTDVSLMTTDVSLMKQKLSTISVSTKDLTASSNNTYVYDTPFQIKSRKMNADRVAATTGIITFPPSPADGDFITLVDSANVFGGEADTYSYSTVVITINFNGKVCKGECSAGSLVQVRKGQVTFKFSTALNQWTGFSLKEKENNNITSDDIWTGYWTPITYSSNPFDPADETGYTNSAINTSYIYIDATKNPIQLSFYEGTPDKPYNNQGAILKSRIPLIYVTGTGTTNTITYPALVKFNDPKFGINQADQADISNCCRFALDPTNLTTMYLYGTRADVYHNYGFDQFFNNAMYKKVSKPSQSYPISLPDNMPYIKSSDDQQVYSFGDPVVLFDWYCDIMTKNCNMNSVYLPYINKSFYGDSYKIKSFIESVKKDGFSVTTPIKNMIVSMSGATVFNTKENCHYCPPGSNVTISGFSGAYTVLNGYYANGVSVNNNYFQNYMHSGTMDYKLTSGIASGSVIDHMNKFTISYDSSSLPYSTGSNALYGQAIFEGNPSVTVTHKVSGEMTYNEWIAACVAVKEKIHGPQSNSWIQCAYDDNTGKVVSSWNTSSFSSKTIQTRARDFPSFNYVNNYGGRFDPYQSQSKLDSLISTDSNLNYNGYIKTGSNVNPLIIHNYLQTGTVANLWYALDKPFTGPYANTFQTQYANKIGSKNYSNTGSTGGSEWLCEMKPYPYSTTDVLPDLDTWNLNAPSTNNGKTGTSILSGVYNGINYLYCGLIRQDLVTSLGYVTSTGSASKKVAYLRIPDTSFFTDNPNKFTYSGLTVFNTPVATGAYQHTGALGQLYFSSVISKYINTLGADALILDDRNGSGGSSPEMFYPFFGGDRLGFNFWTPYTSFSERSNFNDVQTSNDIVNSHKLYSDFSARISPTDMERLFPGSVFKGTSTGPKKIVILHDMNAVSGNDDWIHGWLGNAYKGDIGGNVTCSFIGDSDGRLLGGSSSTRLPVDNNFKVNANLALSTKVSGDAATSFKRHLATGTLSTTNVPFNNIYTETYIRGMSTGATGTLTSVSGNKCFPNNLESTIYQDWGYIPPQPSAVARWIPSDRPVPTPDNLYSYRDAWLENAIREALFR